MDSSSTTVAAERYLDNVEVNEASSKPPEQAMSWAELKSCFWLCPLCHLCMRTPKVLPCLHSLCMECLEKFVTDKHAVSAGRFKCPVCKTLAVYPQKGVMAFATNIYIEHLQQSSNHVIDKFGDRSLDACTCNLCTSYRVTRKNVADSIQSQKENVTADEPSNCEKGSDLESKFHMQDCVYHTNESVLYFCVDCQQPACRLCVELRHRDHRFEPILLAAENARSVLKTTQDVLTVRQQSNDKFLRRLALYSEELTSQKGKTLNDIETCIQHMHGILDRVKDRLIADADRLFSAETTAVSRLSEELELSQQQLLGVSGFLSAHEGHDPAELVQQRFLITDRINQLYAAEQRTSFPLTISFLPTIPGNSKDDQWLLRAELALKNCVGSIVSNRNMAPDFVRTQAAIRGEINKAILLASFTLTIPAQSSHETIHLTDKIHRHSVGSRQAASSGSNEIPLTRHLLPSLSVDPFGYIFSLDRSSGTAIRFFGGCDLAKRVYYFPGDKCRPLRICCVGQTGGFAYIDAFSPTATAQAFSLRFVPRSGDRFDLILPVDRALFSGESVVALPDIIPAIAADQNANIYVLDIDSSGRAVVIVYSMSFGSVRKINLDTSATISRQEPVRQQYQRRTSVISSFPATVNELDVEQTSEKPASSSNAARPVSGTTQAQVGVVSADFASYIACCPHMTGTREVIQATASSCPGIFAVSDTLRDSVRLYDIYGAFICELTVPSPLEKISHPRGVAFDYTGNLVVCDQGNNRLLLFDHTGRRLRGILAAGPPALEALRRPADVVAVPGRHQVVVAEETTNVAKLFDYSTLVAPHK